MIIIANVIGAVGLLDPGEKARLREFARLYDNLQGSSLCVTAATSMIATFVIGAQIYFSTSLNIQARRRYKHIIEIIIQSSALYSIAILFPAISVFVHNANLGLPGSKTINFDAYTSAIASITTVRLVISTLR